VPISLPSAAGDRHNGEVPDFVELTLDDGSAVRLELAPVGDAPVGAVDDPDLPEGFGGVDPVSRGRAAALAVGTLRAVLRPLGAVLQEVHDSVVARPDPPQELNISFGLQLGQDLKLGVVNAGGSASMTVSATWQLPPRNG
jgi:hypothetical protein